MDCDESQETVAELAEAPKAERQYLRRLRIILPFLLLLAFLSWAFTTNYIPSESMVPTLRPGDHILTMRAWLAYPNGRIPARGDIITFLPPESALQTEGPPQPKPALSRGEVWIKRVVGLPNEVIWIGEGRVFINGSPVPDDIYPGHPNLMYFQYPYASLMPLKLKSDELFVLGDNPDDSDDSRSWGPLKRELVVGRFVRVLFREGPRGPNQRRADGGND
jgi:signal peptidase I